jgi:putative FmdB family regulatory protein
MPFYEYQCKNCGHDLEAMQKVNDPPLKKCPHCGKSQLQRLMSAPVFRLKGAGWYETDFKGDGDTKRNLADTPDADAPKDAAKDAAGKDGGKEAAGAAAAGAPGAGAAGAGGEAKGKEGKTAEGAQPKDSPAVKDKSAGKPAEKAPVESAKKPVGSTSASRLRKVARARPAAKKPAKKAASTARRR